MTSRSNSRCLCPPFDPEYHNNNPDAIAFVFINTDARKAIIGGGRRCRRSITSNDDIHIISYLKTKDLRHPTSTWRLEFWRDGPTRPCPVEPQFHPDRRSSQSDRPVSQLAEKTNSEPDPTAIRLVKMSRLSHSTIRSIWKGAILCTLSEFVPNQN